MQSIDTSAAASPPGPSLEDFFENGAIGLHLVAQDGTIIRANRAELSLLGYSSEEYIGRPVADVHADPATIADILQRLTAGETLDKYPARLKAKDGSIRHVLISSSVCFDEVGRFQNTRCFTLDVTEKVQAEQALRQAQQRLTATYDSAYAGIAETDAEGRFLQVNATFEQLTGNSKRELLGRTFTDITHPDDVAADRASYRRQVAGECARYETEKRYVRADGTQIWVHVMSSTVQGEDGGFLYGVRVVHDVTARRRGEERTRVLINELNHRVKNTLATVQSLASQTARSTVEIDDFMERFQGRLIALSSAHDRLTRRNWEAASLTEIVGEELDLHGGLSRGLSYSGPDLALSPRTALALSMALHELGTNALKYGALSGPDGLITVVWSTQRDAHSRPLTVRFEWKETGGPPVASPNASGFGTRLLEAMADEVDGVSHLTFDPRGVCWRLQFPLPPEVGAPEPDPSARD